MADRKSSKGQAAVDGQPAPLEPDSASPSRQGGIAGIAAFTVAILAVGAVVGMMVRARGDTGSPPSHTYAMAGEGMEPTLSHGDQVTARDIDGNKVGRGDVVVVQAPVANGTGSMLIVKRVIAVAGDEIASTPGGGEVLINGEPADEPYLAPGTRTTALDPQEVPAGHVFVMGDNRHNSLDSRSFGPVPVQDVVALVEST